MKFYNKILRFLLSILLIVGLLSIYNGYILLKWLNSKFLDKFEVNIIVSENEDVKNFVKEIKNLESKNLKFKNVDFITKESLFNEIKKNPEFSVVLSVIEENPFFDFIKIKFLKYSEKEFTQLNTSIRSKPFVKEIIFDYNIRSYLSRLDKLKENLEIAVKIFLIIVGLTSVIQIFLLFKNDKNLYLRTIFFTPLYIFFVLANLEILNFIMSSKIKVGYYDITFYILVYVIAALLVNENK
ncbi:MAG: hypothetical protein ACK4WJ_00585 [Endomicrobiia bacterium]